MLQKHITYYLVFFLLLGFTIDVTAQDFRLEPPEQKSNHIQIKKNDDGSINTFFSFAGGTLLYNGPNPQLSTPFLAVTENKVERRFAKKLQQKNDENFIKILIYMNDKPSALAKSISQTQTSKSNGPASIIENLQLKARNTQQAILFYLKSKKNTGEVIDYKSFWIVNMISAKVKVKILKDISNAPEVIAIYEDTPHAPPRTMGNDANGGPPAFTPNLPAWSITKIKADQVWKQGFDGRGIIIGNIDTGVDPTHPSLERKMATIGDGSLGWKDFNENSDTPIDTIGHGTHTIGTMLGTNNNSLNINIGVAPGAKYYSARIFGKNPAYDSVILSAGQWMMDPDSNPSTNDFPRIISNSWGSSDPGSVSPWYRDMIKNWRSVGILPVFSAGNSRRESNSTKGYWTASDPGNYPESLCVAATDNDDKTTYFSSRGPSTYDQLEGIIKPDLSAPGYYVVSAWAKGTNMYGDNQHTLGTDLYIANGTSMAAPHVAGAAAILMQMHPDWSIDQIQSALMDTAQNVNEDIYSQGMGRIDLSRASTIKAVNIPATITLGRVDRSKEFWNYEGKFNVENLSKTDLTYSLTCTPPLPSTAISCLVTPNTLILPSKKSALIRFTITINNPKTPDLLQLPNAYAGKIILKLQSLNQESKLLANEANDLTLPFMFLKSPTIHIIRNPKSSFDYIGIASLDGTFSQGFFSGDPDLQINLPQNGQYNILSESTDSDFLSSYILHENVLVDNIHNKDVFNNNEAAITLKISPVDKNGKPIATNTQEYLFDDLDPKSNFPSIESTMIFNSVEPIYFSTLSLKWKFIWKLHCSKFINQTSNPEITVEKEHYSISGGLLNGISNPISWVNNPLDFSLFKVQFHPIETNNLLQVLTGTGTDSSFGGQPHYIEPPFVLDYYTQITPDPNYSFFDGFEVIKSTHFFPDHISPIYKSLTKNTINRYINPQTPIDSINSNSLDIGVGPFYWIASFKNQPAMIVINSPSFSVFPFLFSSITDDNILPDVSNGNYGYYDLYDETNQLVRNGSLQEEIALPSAGKYKIVIPSFKNYLVKQESGSSNVIMHFDTRKPNKNPPQFSQIKILSNGKISNIMNSAVPNNKIIFSLNDASPIKSIQAICISQRDQVSKKMPVINIKNNSYAILIPQNFLNQSDYVSLNITAQDMDGNSTTHEFTPAFYYNLIPEPKSPPTNLAKAYRLWYTTPHEQDVTC